MNSDPRNDRSIPIIFFITTIIAYGLLLPKTGFYWDDWPFAWIAKFLGPAEFVPAFDGVRPFLGPIFVATTSLIPPVPIYWQIFALLVRFIAGLSAWFAFNQVWPQHKQQTLVASLLFLLFPAYSQHWVAYTHINQEWVSLICFILSFGFTAHALRHPESFYRSSVIAVLFQIAGVFPTEYFVGLEVLRVFFVGIILLEQTGNLRQGLLRSLRIWFPYFLIWMANVLWLAYFYTLGNYDSYEVTVVKEPVTLFQILWMLVDAIWKVGIYAWGQVLGLIGESITTPSSLLTVALIVAAFLSFVVFLVRFYSASETSHRFGLTLLVIGTVGLVVGRLPSLAAGLPLTLQSSWDRLTISMMLGGSLFIIGIVDLLVQNARMRTYIFALLVALAVGQQFFNANIFRRDWEKQQQIYAQLAWRIPAMEPGTALLTDEMPSDYETDMSFTAPLNWIYAPDHTGSELSYALFYTEKRLGGEAMPSLAPGTELSMGLRSAYFHGNTSQAIVIHMPGNGCLRVLDPVLGDAVTYARESRYLLAAIPLSKPDLIRVDSTATPRLPFLPEPDRRWCYYFAKAELARQTGDWQRIIQLFDDANDAGYEPGDPFEWLVFIEAQAMTGDVEDAYQLSVHAMDDDKRVRNGLCQVWKRVYAQTPVRGEGQPRLDEILSEFRCGA